MQNKDFVVALVQKTIQFTEILMEQDAVSWEKAKIGIQRIMLELTSDFPEHSAFIQSEMQIWIDQQDRKRRQSQATMQNMRPTSKSVRSNI